MGYRMDENNINFTVHLYLLGDEAYWVMRFIVKEQ
jgi:hypothetical protein